MSLLKRLFVRDRASPIDPAQAWFEEALVHARSGRHEDAWHLLGQALERRPAWPEALYHRANCCLRTGRPSEALAGYDAALALAPGHGDAHYNRGLALQDLNRHQEAIAAFDRAIAADPRDADAYNNRGNAFLAMRHCAQALESYARALALRPDLAHALFNSGVAWQELRRPDKAAAFFERLLTLAPDYPLAPGKLLHARMLCCDWRDFTRLSSRIDAAVRAGQAVIEPFSYLGIARDPADMRRCAELYAAQYAARPLAPAVAGPAAGRIRVGYVSGEFREQATAILMVEVFERHDRDRFELFAFDNGTADRSDIRRRIESSFAEIVDINVLNDAQAAAAVRERRIDILVDLNGYFGRSRPGLFAHRAAPVQVNYLAFPSTLGAPWMDYLVADRHVVPPGEETAYAEQVVRLPDTYQANDSKRAIAPTPPSREEAGLPGTGVVFCCFNNPWKITPEVFAVWMRVLGQVEGSVLWLLQDLPAASDNLRRAASTHGIDPARLVFAGRVAPADHLARHALADLFLDTAPCNAHTTASDALWAGLPLLTCTGTTFAGRVASSLLHAVGLPELAVPNLAAYESRAVALARDPAELARLRAHLVGPGRASPLFDGERLCRHLERAFQTMAERARRGEGPVGFPVPPLGPSGVTYNRP